MSSGYTHTKSETGITPSLGQGADAFFRSFARTKWAQTDVGINIIISNKSALCWIINWTTGSECSHNVYTRQKKG